jgi:hypothetical protein
MQRWQKPTPDVVYLAARGDKPDHESKKPVSVDLLTLNVAKRVHIAGIC